jgi:hypothetical protein
VSSSLAFHYVCVRFGFNAAPPHHNHSLTTGLIFPGRLKYALMERLLKLQWGKKVAPRSH